MTDWQRPELSDPCDEWALRYSWFGGKFNIWQAFPPLYGKRHHLAELTAPQS